MRVESSDYALPTSAVIIRPLSVEIFKSLSVRSPSENVVSGIFFPLRFLQLALHHARCHAAHHALASGGEVRDGGYEPAIVDVYSAFEDDGAAHDHLLGLHAPPRHRSRGPWLVNFA